MTMRVAFTFFIFYLLCSSTLFANSSIYFETYSLDCSSDKQCKKLDDTLDDLKEKQVYENDFLDQLRLVLVDFELNSFSYSLDDSNHLAVKVDFKPLIRNIKITTNQMVDVGPLLKTIPVKEGGYFEQEDHRETLKMIGKYLVSKGHDDVKIDIDLKRKSDGVYLEYVATIGRVILIKSVSIETKNDAIREISRRRFLKFIGKIWDKLDFKLEVDRLSKDLFEQGYFLSKLEILPPIEKEDGVSLTVQVSAEWSYNFDFKGNKIFSRDELLLAIKKEIKGSVGELSLREIEVAIIKLYADAGLYDTKVSIRELKGTNPKAQKRASLYVKIEEGKKIPVTHVGFYGNAYFKEEELQSFYEENATTLAGRGFLDEKYLKKFVDLLKIRYLATGHALVAISGPEIERSEDGKSSTVKFKVKEGVRSTLASIEIYGTTPSDVTKIKSLLKNREGTPLNLTAVQEDIDRCIEYLHEEGYYFTQMVNIDKKIVEYSEDLTTAKLIFDLKIEKRAIYEGLVIVGNTRTRSKVLAREVDLIIGETVTPNKLERIRERLSSLGLFTSIKITPIVTNSSNQADKDYRVQVIIQVQEKDFGLIEIAPGFRTDIGIKFSTGVHYLNLGGMNRSVAFKAQTNQRLDYNSLDERRQAERKTKLEYLVEADFAEPYLFGKKIEFDFSNSFARRRFFGFDADIIKTSSQIGKSWGDHFSTTLKYQLEIIEQYDATERKDFGYFRIGSLTPGLALDYRDSRVNTRKGFYTALSTEFANPYFYSMDNENLSINFYKVVWRNNAYIPISNWVMAFSLSGGVQVNLATDIRYDESGNALIDSEGNKQTKGYIPSIKLFRLDGPDLVRGFADDEINRLDSGVDIAELIVQDRAYFLNLKFEPRYLISDNIIGGLFYDAGRVFVNHIKPLELRASTGVSLKYLTPVGSLDFDYGVKMHRRDVEGKRESVGRFHLSIGFF